MKMKMDDTNRDKEGIAQDIRRAILAGDKGRVADILGKSETLLRMVTPFGTWLHVASSAGQLAIVRMLLGLGADVNGQGGTFGGGPLNEAATEGHADVVRALLAAGAALDVSDPERNPLFGAILAGNLDIVKMLVKKGIDPTITYLFQGNKSMDARAFAEERGQREIARYLGARKK